MVKFRRKTSSTNSLTSFPPKAESNDIISGSSSFDNLRSSTNSLKASSSIAISSRPVMNGNSHEASQLQNTRTAINRKYFIIFIVLCTLGSLVPLVFHMSIFESYTNEKRILESFAAPNNPRNLKRRKKRAEFSNSTVTKPKEDIREKYIELANLWKRKTPELAKSLSVGYKPSENKPFIFFHQRKAGGSTFRQFLYDAANNLGVRSWIPSCRFGPIPCAVFALPTHAKFAVYGGHFRYMEAHKNFIVTNFKAYLMTKNKPTPKPFTCLVTARPTIDRVVSCWNYRFIQELKLDPKVFHSSTMTPKQWDELLPTAFSKYNEGCNNEFIRNFGDIQDEHVINAMKPTGEEKYDLLALRELNNVFERISNCVVTTLPKCDEGLEVIAYFLPWLQRNAEYDCETKVNALQDHIKKSNQLSPDVEKAILKHNFVDELVYDFIDTLFEEQLKYARVNRKSDEKPVAIKRTKAIKQTARNIVRKIPSNEAKNATKVDTSKVSPPKEEVKVVNEEKKVEIEKNVPKETKSGDVAQVTEKTDTKTIEEKESKDITIPSVQQEKEDDENPIVDSEDKKNDENHNVDSEDNNNLPVDKAMDKEMAALESNIINANPDDKEKQSITVDIASENNEQNGDDTKDESQLESSEGSQLEPSEGSVINVEIQPERERDLGNKNEKNEDGS